MLPVSERLQELSPSALSKGRGDGCKHRLSAPTQGREIGSGRLGSLTDSRVTSSHRQQEKPERSRPGTTCTFLTGRITLAAARLPNTFFFVIKIERGFFLQKHQLCWKSQSGVALQAIAASAIMQLLPSNLGLAQVPSPQSCSLG